MRVAWGCVTLAAFDPGNNFARLRIAPDLDVLCKDNLNELTRQYLDLVTARAVGR